jgi:hypothetical protein
MLVQSCEEQQEEGRRRYDCALLFSPQLLLLLFVWAIPPSAIRQWPGSSLSTCDTDRSSYHTTPHRQQQQQQQQRERRKQQAGRQAGRQAGSVVCVCAERGRQQQLSELIQRQELRRDGVEADQQGAAGLG